MTELEEAELTDGQGRALSAHKSQQAYRAMPSARLSALSQQLANRMLIRWRTRQEQTFRMSGRITYRMPVPKKVRRPVTDWYETLNSGWGGRARTTEWRNQKSPL